MASIPVTTGELIQTLRAHGVVVAWNVEQRSYSIAKNDTVYFNSSLEDALNLGISLIGK